MEDSNVAGRFAYAILLMLALVSCQAQTPSQDDAAPAASKQPTEADKPPLPTGTATGVPTAAPGSTPTPEPTPILGFHLVLSDSDWDGKMIPHGQQCTPQGGQNPSSPQIMVRNIPDGSNAIILEFSDRDYSPMDNGGHGKIGFIIPEGADEVMIPSVSGNTFDLPEGFFLVREHKASFTFTAGAYMPPCSGGLGNHYYVTAKAVEMISMEELTFNVLAEAILELGRY